MKRAVFVAIAAVVALAGCATTRDPIGQVAVSANYQEYRPRVYAVLPFAVEPNEGALYDDEVEDYEEEYGAYVPVRDDAQSVTQEAFEDALVTVGADVVVRSRVSEILSEIEFQQMAGLTANDAAEVGAMLNADAVVIGTITLMNRYYVSTSVRAVDVERGVVLWSAAATADVFMFDISDSDYDPAFAMRAMARSLMEQVAEEW